jgi:hypothetical protein
MDKLTSDLFGGDHSMIDARLSSFRSTSKKKYKLKLRQFAIANNPERGLIFVVAICLFQAKETYKNLALGFQSVSTIASISDNLKQVKSLPKQENISSSSKNGKILRPNSMNPPDLSL